MTLQIPSPRHDSVSVLCVCVESPPFVVSIQRTPPRSADVSPACQRQAASPTLPHTHTHPQPHRAPFTHTHPTHIHNPHAPFTPPPPTNATLSSVHVHCNRGGLGGGIGVLCRSTPSKTDVTTADGVHRSCCICSSNTIPAFLRDRESPAFLERSTDT